MAFSTQEFKQVTSCSAENATPAALSTLARLVLLVEIVLASWLPAWRCRRQAVAHRERRYSMRWET
jgi:hypothetical protein